MDGMNLGKTCGSCGSSMTDKEGCLTCGATGDKYGTTQRGKVKFDIGSKQDIYLHTNDIDHSHVTVKDDGSKSIKRYGENYDK